LAEEETWSLRKSHDRDRDKESLTHFKVNITATKHVKLALRMAASLTGSDSTEASSSLLEVFIQTARSPVTAGRCVLECGHHSWTYATLDTISSGLAEELKPMLGSFPTVAVVSENHPFVFALMLAVWKLGGIFVPIDVHVPATLLAGMIDLVKPTSLFLSASDVSNISNARGVFLFRTPDGCHLTFH
jgi:acyl-CoA synthetase (AMP-forming)/AMP-acid ligase II